MYYNKEILEEHFERMYDFDRIVIHSEIEDCWKAEAIYMITLYNESDIMVGSFVARYYYGDNYPHELTEKSDIRKLLSSIVSINDIYTKGFRQIG